MTVFPLSFGEGAGGEVCVSPAKKDYGALALFWLFFLLQALTSFNYLFMLTFTVGICLLTMLFLQWQQRGVQAFACGKLKFALLIIGGCVVGALLMPLIVPYLKANREMGFQRTLAETEALSARLPDYFVAPDNNWLYGQFTKRFQSADAPFPREQMLFYGITPMLLAMLGIFGGTIRIEEKQEFIFRRTYLILFLIAGLLSFGPAVNLWGKSFALPYAWLYYVVPGLKSMRVPARFGLLAAFALTVLAAFGVARLCELVRTKTRFGGKPFTHFIITGLLGGLILLEYFSPAKVLSFYPATAATIPAAYQWLAQHPEVDRLIELPVRFAKDDFDYTYYSTFHWKRMVNGRSAFIPNGIVQVLEEMRGFPAPRAVALLKSLGVRYVLLHGAKFDQPLPATFPNGLALRQTFERDLLLEILPTTPGIAENSGQINSRRIALEYHLPARLRPAEQYTLGIFLKSPAPEAWSPLPHEKLALQITWQTAAQAVLQERRELTLPIFVPAGEHVAFPLPITTPAQRDAYQVVIETNAALFEPQAFTKQITITPDVLDSRRPGKLQAEFLRVELPAAWERGKPLRVRASVKNSGDTLWKARAGTRKQPAGEVHLNVFDWQEAVSGKSLKESQPQLFQARGFLPYDVAPGEEVSLTMEMRTPDLAGEFLIQLDLISELIQWFSAQGSQPFQQKIILQ